MGRVSFRGLAVGGTHQEQFVKFLEGTTVVAELDGEPVEQFRMGRFLAETTEVIGGGDDAFPEVPLPHACATHAHQARAVWVSDDVKSRCERSWL